MRDAFDALKAVATAIFNWSAQHKHKVWLVVYATVALLIVNHLTGFSFYFTNYYRTEQIARINEAIPQAEMTQEEIGAIQAIRHDIIFRENLLSKFYKNVIASFKETPVQDNISLIDTKGKQLSTLYLFLSSTWWVLLFMLAFPLYAIYKPKGKYTISITIILQGAAIIMAFILYNTISFIFTTPIRGEWFNTYSLAWALSTIMLVASLFFFYLTQEKKTC